ncbi:MAG: hypothetical protein BJBARM5_1112, partial [Candidatus Parvarchaeum acidophilus ARMAN-5]
MVNYKGLDGIDKSYDPYFGVAKLDEELKGIPSKKLVLIAASPSVGNEVFGYQIINKNINSDVKTLVFLNRTSPQSYMEDMKEYDLPSSDKMFIMDAYSDITGIKANETDHIFAISNPYDKNELKTKLLSELDKGYGLLVMDSLSLLIDFFDFEFVDSLVSDIKDAVQKNNSAAVFLFTNWGYDKEGSMKKNELLHTDYKKIKHGFNKNNILIPLITSSLVIVLLIFILHEVNFDIREISGAS